jgi:hypothetical protein
MFGNEVTKICYYCFSNNNSVRRILLLFKIYLFVVIYYIILFEKYVRTWRSLKTDADGILVVSLRLAASWKLLYPKSVATTGCGRQAQRLVAATCRTLETVP